MFLHFFPVFLKNEGPDRHPALLKNPISYEKPNDKFNPCTKTGSDEP
jgi:hypothetical protein